MPLSGADKNRSRDTIYTTDEHVIRRACGRGARGLGGDLARANRGVVFAVHRRAQSRAGLLCDGGRGLPVLGVRAMVHGIGELLRRPLHADHVPSGGGADHPRTIRDRGRGRAADGEHRCGSRCLAGLDGLHGGLVAAVALQALPTIPARSALREGVRRLRMEKALARYLNLEFTLSRAAQYAGVPIRDMADLAAAKGIPFFRISLDELRRDRERTGAWVKG